MASPRGGGAGPLCWIGGGQRGVLTPVPGCVWLHKGRHLSTQHMGSWPPLLICQHSWVEGVYPTLILIHRSNTFLVSSVCLIHPPMLLIVGRPISSVNHSINASLHHGVFLRQPPPRRVSSCPPPLQRKTCLVTHVGQSPAAGWAVSPHTTPHAPFASPPPGLLPFPRQLTLRAASPPPCDWTLTPCATPLNRWGRLFGPLLCARQSLAGAH